MQFDTRVAHYIGSNRMPTGTRAGPLRDDQAEQEERAAQAALAERLRADAAREEQERTRRADQPEQPGEGGMRGVDASMAALISAMMQSSRESTMELMGSLQQQLLRIVREGQVEAGAGFTKPRPKGQMFDGARDQLQIWLFAIEEDFKATRRTSDEDRIAYAITLLEGAALWWLYGLTKRGERPTTWNDFKRQLGLTFRSDNDQVRLREELRGVRQITTVAKYAAEFTRVLLRTEGIDEYSALLHFYDGLNPRLIAAVRDRAPETVLDAIRYAQNQEDAQARVGGEREKERPWQAKPDGNTTRPTWIPKSTSTGSSTTTASSSTAKATMAQTVMAEAQAVGQSKKQFTFPGKLGADERERLLRQGACFKCRQQGHTAAQCPVQWPERPERDAAYAERVAGFQSRR